MGQESVEPPTDDSAVTLGLIARVVNKLPHRFTAFWLRFTGVFVSRRMSMMAAVSAFWAIFAFPWILIVFLFVVALISQLMGNQAIRLVEESIVEAANKFLTPEAAQSFAVPILETLFGQSLTGLGIVGAIVAVWSGSKAVLSLMDAITFIEENTAPAGYFVRRALAIVLMLGAIVGIALIAPLVLVGPKQLGDWLHLSADAVWVIVSLLSLLIAFAMLIVLYRTSTIHFKHWNRYVPGAALATVAAAIGIVGLGLYVRRMFESNAFLGTLLTPIAMMTTAYVLCLIVLAGAVFNYVKSVGTDVDSVLPAPLPETIAHVEAEHEKH